MGTIFPYSVLTGSNPMPKQSHGWFCSRVTDISVRSPLAAPWESEHPAGITAARRCHYYRQKNISIITSTISYYYYSCYYIAIFAITSIKTTKIIDTINSVNTIMTRITMGNITRLLCLNRGVHTSSCSSEVGNSRCSWDVEAAIL